MRRRWRQFDLAEQTSDSAVWFGGLVGIERPYRVVLEYGLPLPGAGAERWRTYPVVRVLSPQLQPNFDALEEAPLPHVYFDDKDITLSVNRRWIGTPYRHPKGTPLSGEFGR